MVFNNSNRYKNLYLFFIPEKYSFLADKKMKVHFLC
jgi:hypothetical protein